MKKPDPGIEREVEKTLAQLDQVKRVTCDPHFVTRVMAGVDDLRKGQIEIRHSPARLYGLLIPGICALVLLINITSALWFFQAQEPALDSRNTYLTAVAEDYSLNTDHIDIFSP